MGYWWESQNEKRTLGRLRRRCVDNIKMDLRQNVVVKPGFFWLRKGAGGRLL
jgi:hypothetical protein